MSDRRPVEMDGAEITDFLDRHSIGTLALARENDAYAIPVSFAFDGESRDVYVRLGFTPESQKREFVGTDGLVTLVAFDETDGRWQSVVARGRLEEVTESSLDSTIEEAVHGLDIPYVTIFDRPASNLEFRLYRLDVDKLHGRKQVPGAP